MPQSSYQVTFKTSLLATAIFVLAVLVMFLGSLYMGYHGLDVTELSTGTSELATKLRFSDYVQTHWRSFLIPGFLFATVVYSVAVVLFYWFVQRHVIHIAHFMRDSSLDDESALLELPAGPFTVVPDYLAYLQKTINKMLTTIGSQFESLKVSADEIKRSELEHQRILDNLQDTYYHVDASGLFLNASASGEQLIGYRPDEVVGAVRMGDLYAEPEDRVEFLRQLSEGGGKIEQWHTRLVHKDGTIVSVATSARALFDENGEMIGVEGTTRDITAQLLASERLFEEKELALVTLRSIADAVITTDDSGYVTFMNPVAEMLTDCTNESDIGRNISELFHIVDDSTRVVQKNPVDRSLQKNKVIRISDDKLLVNRSSNQFFVELTASPLVNSAGDLYGTVVVFRDVSETREVDRKIKWQARHDPLTGLFNRNELQKQLADCIHNTSGENSSTFLYMDLDRFKIVNDTCGHIAGDSLLRQLSFLLKKQIRSNDVLARVGGDEFGLLLNSCPMDQAMHIAENIRKAIHDFRFSWSDKIFETGVSIGVVTIDHRVNSVTDVLSMADLACYTSKNKGRNRIHIYKMDDSQQAQYQHEVQWVSEINHAFDEDRFQLYYQPIYPLIEGPAQAVYSELALRMISESGEIIPPSSFLSSAERYNLMSRIDHWVFSKTLEFIDLYSRGRGVFVVNVSASSMSDEAFHHYIATELVRLTIDPAQLCFEVSESAAITHLSQAHHFITLIKELGCRFGIDGFGSGLSSMIHLKNLPVDYLKIDGNIIKDVMSDHIDCMMVESINNMAHKMGLKTVAAHIESREVFEKVKSMGIDFGQGFYFDQPKPLVSDSVVKFAE
ncbi:MAG: EAL domain-containing protein [Pseudomonadales bacterium]|nr:EAL domain-containing protein [Pseudomonadales bacterium]